MIEPGLGLYAIAIPAAMLALMSVTEWLRPRRNLVLGRYPRWLTHALFFLTNAVVGRILSMVVVVGSAAAWADEAHVATNRALYRAKFEQVMPVLQPVLDVTLPDAAFYLWAGVPGGIDEIAFACGLLAQYNVNAMPGRLLARDVNGHNPGAGRIRLALVAPVAECLEAAHRIAAYTRSLP